MAPHLPSWVRQSRDRIITVGNLPLYLSSPDNIVNIVQDKLDRDTESCGHHDGESLCVIENIALVGDPRGMDWKGEAHLLFSSTEQALLAQRSLDFTRLYQEEQLGWAQRLMDKRALALSENKLRIARGGSINRYLYAAVGRGRMRYRLPESLVEKLKEIANKACLSEGPIGRLSDKFTRQVGDLRTEVHDCGFKNFEQALRSIKGITIYADKATNQPFFSWGGVQGGDWQRCLKKKEIQSRERAAKRARTESKNEEDEDSELEEPPSPVFKNGSLLPG